MSDDVKRKALEVLKSIREDVANDVKTLDGKPFNGRTVAETFGHLYAMVDALADVQQRTIADTLLGHTEVESDGKS